MAKKRILIFSLSYFPLVGGAEIAMKEITDRVQDIELDMVTLRFSKSHPRVERIGNINVYRVGGGLGYLSKIFFIPRAVLFAMRRRYDAYWCMMTYMLFPIALLRLLGNRTPYALTLQDGDPFERVFVRMRVFPFVPLLMYGFRKAAKVQAISNFLAEWAYKMGYRGRVEVIPNGVDVKKFSNQESGIRNQDETILITTSRLVEKNGVGDIIEAMKFLPENYKLKILGSGPLESELKQQTANLKLQTRVEFLGHVPNDEIPRHLQDANIFVRPSISEGQGISFIEAMAAGLPVIATPVGGIPDFIKDGETGLFCEVNNPESIAGAVKKLMDNPELRQKLVENGQKLAREKYDWDLIAGQMQSRVFYKV